MMGKKDYLIGMRTKFVRNVKYLKYIGIWAAAFLISTVTIKAPYMIANGIVNDHSGGKVIKNILIGYNQNKSDDKVLLAQLDTEGLAELNSTGTSIDDAIIAQYNSELTPQQCEADYGDMSLDELNSDLPERVEGG